MQNSSRINKMVKYANFVGAAVNKLKICSFDGALFTKRNITTFVTMSEILMKEDCFGAYHHNISPTILSFIPGKRMLSVEHPPPHLALQYVCTLSCLY